MKLKRFSETQIIRLSREYDAGKETIDIRRENVVSRATFYNWEKKYGGMDASPLKRLKELEKENRRLKHMYADISLDHDNK